MSKTTTTTVAKTVKPTEQQAMLIRLATRKQGVTRAQVRDALNYVEGANIPVQTMLKTIATRHGLGFETDYVQPKDGGRAVAVYRMVLQVKPAVKPAKSAKAKASAKTVAAAKTRAKAKTGRTRPAA